MDQWHLMQLAVASQQGTTVVHVVGELTAVSGPRLLRLCDGLLARLPRPGRAGASALTVDLSGVRRFEVEGVEVLREVRDRCAAAGAALVVEGVSDRRGALPLRVERLLDEILTGTPVLAGG
jgi:anti-anti-sigma regulatory factor